MDDFISRRTLLQELPFLSIEPTDREKVRYLIERMKPVDMLDRDTGMEPILEEGKGLVHVNHTDGTSEWVEPPYLDWKCPKCGWFVGELYSGFGMWHIQDDTTYCSRCGQKIDWTKPQDEEKRKYEERRAKEREEFEKQHKVRLDNMNKSRRIKYGVTKPEGEGS